MSGVARFGRFWLARGKLIEMNVVFVAAAVPNDRLIGSRLVFRVGEPSEHGAKMLTHQYDGGVGVSFLHTNIGKIRSE